MIQRNNIFFVYFCFSILVFCIAFFLLYNANNATEECYKKSISNALESHKEYKICRQNYIRIHGEYAAQVELITDIEVHQLEKVKKYKADDKRVICKEELDAYKKYLEFTRSIDEQAEKMDMCNSLVKAYRDCFINGDDLCAMRYHNYLYCNDTLLPDHYDKIQASYGSLLRDKLEVRKELTDFFVNREFSKMTDLYLEKKKKIMPLHDCQFICSLKST